MKARGCNNMMSRIFRLGGLLAVVVLLAGCVEGRSQLEAYVAEVKSRPGPPLEPLPVMRQFEVFEYRAFDLRDPFSIQTDEQVAQSAGSGPRPDPNRRKELLETFPLDGLTMAGTLGTDGGVIALIMDPSGVIHRVTAGNYLGQNEGRVLAISEGQVDLLELVSDGAGGWIERRASVALDEK